MFVMKKIITLLLIAFTAFSFNSKAQTTLTCNADFNPQFLNSNTVKFNPVMTGDSNNTYHLWSFGDGNVAINILSPTNIYLAPGTYNVGHSIHRYVNGITCSDTITKQVIIQSVPCNLQAYFIWHADSLSWNTIHFENKSIPYEAGDSIRWNFGDNSPPINGLAGSLSFPTHVYPNAGSYNVCIRVKKNGTAGSAPCVSEICKTVVVTTPCNLVVNFIAQPDPSHPLRIKYTNTSVPLNNSDSIRWVFGDGTSASGLQSDPNIANPTHDYAQGASYTVCLIVKKNGNATGTTPCIRDICKTVNVESPCNIQVHFSMHRDSVNPRKVYFTNQTVTPNSNATAKWTFGDGTSAGTWDAVHEYAQPGSYRVCLTVQSSPNCIRESCDTIVIPSPPLCQDISKFKFEKFSNDNQKYKFIPDYIAADIVYTWTFGDGTGSHDPIAVHRYAQPGVYIACLTAWRGPNCASTTCKEIRVLPQINCDSIHVSYSYQRDPFVTNKLYFYANANFPILDQTWTITRISPASTTPPVILHQNNPVYVFHDTGYFRVCLKAITLGGCVKEYCSVIRIEHIVSNVCELQAFPNPASSLVNVNVTLTQPGMIDAYIYNSTNILVKEKHQQGITGNNTVSINVNDLTPGLYTMKVQYNGKVCYARFTKL
jgi:PKD repeat protein